MVTLSDLYNEANTPNSPYKWWSSSSGEIELVIHIDDAHKGYHQGACDDDDDDDDDITELIDADYIKAQLNRVPPKTLSKILKEYFFDSDEDPECKNHENNKLRLLWIACGDIVDNPEEEEVPPWQVT